MSQKKPHTESYFLIDADEYHTISQLKDKCAVLEKQLAEALKYKDLAASATEKHLHARIGSLQEELNKHQNQQKTSSETYDPDSQDQIGSGNSSLAKVETLPVTDTVNFTESCHVNLLKAKNDQDFRRTLVTAFEQFLSGQKPSVSTSHSEVDQCGSGIPSDVTPILPTPIDSDSVASTASNLNQPESEEITDSQDSQNNLDSFNEKLVSLVPPTSRPKAAKLLAELKNYTNEFSVDSSGSITLNGQLIPDSNFYEIFPLLYQRQEKKRDKGSVLSLVVNELASLGLGHLIQRSFLAGLIPRGQKYLKDRNSVRANISGKWYYLGQHE
jgi:hypothetical protein